MLTQTESKKCIDEHLLALEADNGVKLLYACEAGSRAWGFESADSDYDVRFIYLRPTRQYLALDTSRDVIERPGPVFDFSGWDIKKAFHLFRKGNPPLLEWLYSPIVYAEAEGRFAITDPLRDLANRYFQKRALIHHYLHMCARNWKAYLQEEPIWTKKYLYVLRAVLACAWIDTHNTVPPVMFKTLWTDVQDITADRYDAVFCDAVTESTNMLLTRKAEGTELGKGPRSPTLHQFIESELAFFHERVKSVPKMTRDEYQELTDTLDTLFRQCLVGYDNSM